MKKMEEIFENVMIGAWAQRFRRSPYQVNKLHEADVELIEIPEDTSNYLALTIDTVAEEILVGLYKNAYTMGWVAIAASLSDLAAVGANALGVLISVSADMARDQSVIGGISKGMEDACRRHEVFILGGDTNITPAISLTCCAVGIVPRATFMTRIGCKPGDAVYTTGGLGIGNTLGFVKLTGCPDELFPEENYRPAGRLKEAQIIRDYASSCMDTSDGLLTTLDQLMRLNGVGFEVECDWQKILALEVFDFCSKTKTPFWAMLAGPHGEFELVFTIPAEKINEFNKCIGAGDIQPIRVGSVRETPGLILNLPSEKKVSLDMAPLRNLLQTVEGNLEQYVVEFRSFGRKLGLE